MNKQKVLSALKVILAQLQHVVHPPLLNSEQGLAFYDKEIKLVEIKTPRVDISKRSDPMYVIEGVLDGLIDLLYYAYFSFSKFIEPDKMTEMMSLVNEFYEASKTDTSYEIKPDFAWKYLLSEMFEIMVIFGDDYIESIKNIVTPGEAIDIRQSLHELENVVLNEAEKLGISNIQFIEAFRLVHGANMSKKYPDGTFHRNTDGHIQKPPGWKECDLTDVVTAIYDKLYII